MLFSRPSIDVLFESAADAYGAGLVGVVLTGANDDGARGPAAIVEARAAAALVEDPDDGLCRRHAGRGARRAVPTRAGHVARRHRRLSAASLAAA